MAQKIRWKARQALHRAAGKPRWEMVKAPGGSTYYVEIKDGRVEIFTGARGAPASPRVHEKYADLFRRTIGGA